MLGNININKLISDIAVSKTERNIEKADDKFDLSDKCKDVFLPEEIDGISSIEATFGDDELPMEIEIDVDSIDTEREQSLHSDTHSLDPYKDMFMPKESNELSSNEVLSIEDELPKEIELDGSPVGVPKQQSLHSETESLSISERFMPSEEALDKALNNPESLINQTDTEEDADEVRELCDDIKAGVNNDGYVEIDNGLYPEYEKMIESGEYEDEHDLCNGEGLNPEDIFDIQSERYGDEYERGFHDGWNYVDNSENDNEAYDKGREDGEKLRSICGQSHGKETKNEEINENENSPNSRFTIDGIQYRTDDTGKVYMVDGKLSPNTTYELNGNEYTTDDKGRIIRCEAHPQRTPENKRDIDAQVHAGGENRHDNDQGGHIVSRDLGGDSGAGNLVAMDSRINQSDYKRMENFVKNALDEGKEVSTKTEITYSDDSDRPDDVKVTVTIDGKDTVYIFDNNLDGSLINEVPERGKEVVQDRLNDTNGVISSIREKYDENGNIISSTVTITYADEQGSTYRTEVRIDNIQGGTDK